VIKVTLVKNRAKTKAVVHLKRGQLFKVPNEERVFQKIGFSSGEKRPDLPEYYSMVLSLENGEVFIWSDSTRVVLLGGDLKSWEIE
tara:strand:- start:7229 stop:7486 length:258 start_codon:yes stop_codon:yes gene_type:complete